MPAAKRPRRADLIAEEYRDSDGYWIYLTPGWQNGADPGTHGIVESTKREAHSQLSLAKPCDCADCLKLIAHPPKPRQPRTTPRPHPFDDYEGDAPVAKNPHAVALGRRGGLKGGPTTSLAKAAAARANGAKGGRPRKADPTWDAVAKQLGMTRAK